MDLHEEFERVRRERESEDSIDSLVSSFAEKIDECSADELHNWAVYLYGELLEKGEQPQEVIRLTSDSANDMTVDRELALLKNSIFWLTVLVLISFFV
jgi:hypothetical protein